MSKPKLNPGQNSGNNGGIFQETGPKGGKYPNYTTVPDHHKMPPTQAPNRHWEPLKRTPDSQR